MSAIIQPTGEDRILTAVRDIIRTEIASLRLQYASTSQYSIAAVNGEKPNQTIDCTPVDDTIGLPSLSGVPLQREIAGCTAIPDIGMQCTVVFLNRDPGLPRITGWGPSGDNPIARVGDRCTMFFPPQINLVFETATVGPCTGYIQLTDRNVDGFITVGSARDFSG